MKSERFSRALPLFLVALLVGGCDESEPYRPIILDSLEVTGTKTDLNPAFDPDIFRYSVVASELANELAVTASASASVVISINGDITSSDTTRQLDNLNPGDTVRIDLRTRGPQEFESAVYEIVYLPSDFPELTVSLLDDEASADPLYLNLNGPNSNYVAIVDNYGVPSFFRRENSRVFDFKWHSETGERSYARFTATQNEWGRRNSEIVVLDADFNEIEQITTTGLSHTDQHDFLVLPNNELVLISYDGSIRDLTAFGLSAAEIVEDSVIQVIDRGTRQVLFEWNSWGQVPYEDQSYPNVRREYAHVNSVFEDTDGGLIISARGVSQVVKISRPGGQVLWKLGGKSNQFEFIGDPYPHLCGQHTASRLESGNILIFDNGQNCWPIIESRGDLTRVVEYRLDETAMTAELVWSYSQADTFTTSQGSAQRLSNGNTLIGWGRGPVTLATEITSDQTKVFEISAFDEDGPVVGYRVRRFPM